MAHASRIELLWPYTRPEERHGFPSFGHRSYQDQPPPAPSGSKKAIWWVSIALSPSSSTYLSASRLSISLIPGLIALPPSPTSPSPTLSMAKPIMHRHVRIAFFSFPFGHLAHISSSFLLPIFPR